MDFRFDADDQAFREDVRTWLRQHLVGEYAAVGDVGGPADDTGWDVRVAWERELAAGGWTGLAWPTEHGGREATLTQQMIFLEECARAHAPARISSFGEGMLAPTLIAFGSEEQKQRFLPGIRAGEDLWCQGYSEPDAGSDLASVKTRAVRDGDEWVITGQKVWTTMAHHADWIFAVCRTDPDAPKHKGLSFLLVPMHQQGITVKPLRELTGAADFNEVFFDEARTDASLVVGDVNDGWKVAVGLLGFERGTSFLAHQMRFANECDLVIDYAKKHDLAGDPTTRQKLANAWIGVQIMKYNGFRNITKMLAAGEPGPEASITKLYWSQWHRDLGELEMTLMGPWSEIIEGEANTFQSTFLQSRAETIYSGSSEIQKNIIGERVLGLPREPAVS